MIYVTGSVPSEIMLLKLLSQGCDVTLRSAFTSSIFYLLNTEIKIEYVDNIIPDFMYDFYNYLQRNILKQEGKDIN